jgi:hypothetical protein
MDSGRGLTIKGVVVGEGSEETRRKGGSLAKRTKTKQTNNTH